MQERDNLNGRFDFRWDLKRFDCFLTRGNRRILRKNCFLVKKTLIEMKLLVIPKPENQMFVGVDAWTTISVVYGQTICSSSNGRESPQSKPNLSNYLHWIQCFYHFFFTWTCSIFSYAIYSTSSFRFWYACIRREIVNFSAVRELTNFIRIFIRGNNIIYWRAINGKVSWSFFTV